MNTKFALRRPNGSPLRLLGATFLTPLISVMSPMPGHIIFVVDRSGSMYYDMESVRQTLDRMIGAGDMTSLNLKVTLISYSGQGDFTQHFTGVPIGKVASDPACTKAIKDLQATCLTSPAQAMGAALQLVEAASGEAVTVVVHSDGYANDPSVRDQKEECIRLAKQMAAAGAVVSTVAHRDGSDFSFLSTLAAAGGGQCLRATDSKQLYQALSSTATGAAGRTVPTLRVPLGGAVMAVAVDAPNRRVVASEPGDKELVLRGLSQAPTVYLYSEMSQPEFDSAGCAENSDPRAALALALASMNRGDKVQYQRSLIGSRVVAVQDHWRAVSAADQVAAVACLEDALFSQGPLTLREEAGVVSAGPSIMDVLNVLDRYSNAVSFNLTALKGDYKVRGLRRITGTRNADGKVEEFPYSLSASDEWARLCSVDVNRGAPNVNATLRRPAKLLKKGSGANAPSQEITEVAGVPLGEGGLNLSEVKAYTLVGEGSVYTKEIRVRLQDKRAHAALQALGLPLGTFSPASEVSIDLTRMPVVSAEPNGAMLDLSSLKHLLRAQMLEKTLEALTKGESAKYDAATIEALGEVGLSAAGNFSPPTTLPYDDEDEALRKGVIDTRVTYKVTVGIPGLLEGGSKLPSANEFLKRRFARADGAKDDKKKALEPKMADLMTGTKMAVKELSGRTQLGLVDELAFSIFEDLVGLGSGDAVRKVLRWCTGDASQAGELCSELLGALAKGDKDAVVAAADRTKRVVGAAVEDFYRKAVAPVVLFAGATGTIPSDIEGKVVTAETLVAQGTKVNTDLAAEGIFFLTNEGAIITTCAQKVLYSTSQAA